MSILVGSFLFYDLLYPSLQAMFHVRSAEAAGIYFLKTVGGASTDHNTYTTAMDLTSDGGMIIAAITSSFGVSGSMISKIAGDGTVEWTKTIAAIYAQGVAEVTDGGFMIFGYTSSFSLGNQGWAVSKLNSSGVEQWTVTLNASATEDAYTIVATSDGGAIIGGRSSTSGNEPIAAKITSTGTVTWSRRYGTSSYDDPKHIIPTTDGGYFLAGSTLGFSTLGSGAVFIEKLNSSGVEQWTKTVDGSGGETVIGAVETADGGFLTVGGTTSWGQGSTDIFLMKFNSSGVEQWTKTIGGTAYEQAYSVSETSNGDLLITGTTQSVGTSGAGFLIRTDSSGNEIWSKMYDGSGSDIVRIAHEDSDGSIFLSGQTASFGAGSNDQWVGRLDENGEIDDECSPFGDITGDLTWATQTLSEVNRSITDGTFTLTRVVQTVTEVDQTADESEQCYYEPPAPEETQITVNVQPSFSMNISGGIMDLGAFVSGSIAADSLQVQVQSNVSDGYTLYIDDITNTGLSSGTDGIPMVTGTLSEGTAGAGWSANVAGTNLADNGGSCPGNRAVTNIGTAPFAVISTSAPSEDLYTLCFAVAVGISTPSGTYAHNAQLTFVPHY